MFDWLFEGRTSVYVVLAALAGFLLVLWWQTRKRWFLLGIVVAAALTGIYAILDVVVETDREQIVRRVNALAAAVTAHNLDGIFVNISDDFHSPAGKSKTEVRDLARLYLEQKIVTGMKVWDIVCTESPSREKGTTQVSFSVKVAGFRDFLADCDAVFDFDLKQGWRLKSVRLLKPQTTEEWPQQF